MSRSLQALQFGLATVALTILSLLTGHSCFAGHLCDRFCLQFLQPAGLPHPCPVQEPDPLTGDLPTSVTSGGNLSSMHTSF